MSEIKDNDEVLEENQPKKRSKKKSKLKEPLNSPKMQSYSFNERLLLRQSRKV